MIPPDPVDPTAHAVTDIAEGAIDGEPVDSLNGSELLAGGDDE